MNQDTIDPELITHGDKRNVIDKFRNWKVEAIAKDLANRAFPFHVAIENYQHDYNIGTIVRSANAFNAAGVHIIGKRHWNRRGAMATEKYLQLHHHTTVADFVAWAHQSNQTIIGIDNIPGSSNLVSASLPQKAVFVFGQEGPGLSTEIQIHCTQIIAIEQFGSTRSVNVGVAAGIIMYEWARRNQLSKTSQASQEAH
jgi:tRNA G18 (ribose-2'-O)-methylase SpoU